MRLWVATAAAFVAVVLDLLYLVQSSALDCYRYPACSGPQDAAKYAWWPLVVLTGVLLVGAIIRSIRVRR